MLKYDCNELKTTITYRFDSILSYWETQKTMPTRLSRHYQKTYKD